MRSWEVMNEVMCNTTIDGHGRGRKAQHQAAVHNGEQGIRDEHAYDGRELASW
jgi:hypothetical protein